MSKLHAILINITVILYRTAMLFKQDNSVDTEQYTLLFDKTFNNENFSLSFMFFSDNNHENIFAELSFHENRFCAGKPYA